MNWMVKWASPFPVFVEWAEGARFADVDGHEYVDFCLGDTGAMAGHSPAPTVAAVAAADRSWHHDHAAVARTPSGSARS